MRGGTLVVDMSATDAADAFGSFSTKFEQLKQKTTVLQTFFDDKSDRKPPSFGANFVTCFEASVDLRIGVRPVINRFRSTVLETTNWA